MIKTRLQAKVEARNLVNAAALEHGPCIIAALAPFIGQPVKNLSGEKTAKLVKALVALGLPDSMLNTVQVIVRVDSSWFRAEFQSRVSTADHTAYGRQTVPLGDLFGRTLTKLAPPPTASYCRTDYTAEEILAARRKVEVAREALRDVECGLCGFGEHDN